MCRRFRSFSIDLRPIGISHAFPATSHLLQRPELRTGACALTFSCHCWTQLSAPLRLGEKSNRTPHRRKSAETARSKSAASKLPRPVASPDESSSHAAERIPPCGSAPANTATRAQRGRLCDRSEHKGSWSSSGVGMIKGSEGVEKTIPGPLWRRSETPTLTTSDTMPSTPAQLSVREFGLIHLQNFPHLLHLLADLAGQKHTRQRHNANVFAVVRHPGVKQLKVEEAGGKQDLLVGELQTPKEVFDKATPPTP